MLHHLLELRKRILYVITFFLLLFALFFVYSSALLTNIMLPLLHELQLSDYLIATNITTPLFAPLKIAMNAAMLCSVPFFLYQAWRFMAPGLYRQERKLFIMACCASVSLFLCGMLFCFYAVLPWMFKLIRHALPVGVHFLPDLASAVDFTTHMLLIFGICFQIPIVCVLLVYLGIIKLENLVMLRPYMIVLAFTLGMLLTPPDVFSQIMLALPLWFLFELGLLAALILRRK
jgi:sec-independent protein translocase protein TatC